jgi:hypothetical protein
MRLLLQWILIIITMKRRPVLRSWVHRHSVNTGDSNLARRIAALPYDSEARLAVLKLFRCYSLATALLLLESSSAEQREALEGALTNIFERVEAS